MQLDHINHTKKRATFSGRPLYSFTLHNPSSRELG
jgi:hypothetical protein